MRYRVFLIVALLYWVSGFVSEFISFPETRQIPAFLRDSGVCLSLVLLLPVLVARLREAIWIGVAWRALLLFSMLALSFGQTVAQQYDMAKHLQAELLVEANTENLLQGMKHEAVEKDLDAKLRQGIALKKSTILRLQHNLAAAEERNLRRAALILSVALAAALVALMLRKDSRPHGWLLKA